MSETHYLRQKRHPRDSLEEIFTEFYILEKIVKMPNFSKPSMEKQYTLRCTVIRLVTIIEQFLHTVLAEKINTEPAKHDSDSINVHEALLIDTIQTNEYSWHSTIPSDVKGQIQRFLKSHNVHKTRNDHYKLNKRMFIELLRPYCHVDAHRFWNVAIAHERSFQNSDTIQKVMSNYGIDVFDDTDLSIEKYDRLANARHILVHTINDVVFDIGAHIKPTMRMFKRVLTNADHDDSHVAFICGYALNEAKRHDEAITVLHDVVEHTPHSGAAFKSLGSSYYAKGDAVSGKQHLMVAIGIAHSVHNMFGTRSRPRGTAYASKADLSNAWVNNAVLYREIGETFRVNDEIDLATQCFEAALIQCPSYILLQEDIGGKFLGMEMNDKASVCFRKVVAAAPTNTFALGQLGLIYGVSDPKKSKKYYKKVLKLEPENRSAKHALESLRGV